MRVHSVVNIYICRVSCAALRYSKKLAESRRFFYSHLAPPDTGDPTGILPISFVATMTTDSVTIGSTV